MGPLADPHPPELTAKGRHQPTASTLVPLDAEIRQLLDQVRTPTTAWRRLKRQGRLTVSLASFRRYVHDVLPTWSSGSMSRCGGRTRHRGEEAQVDYGLLGMWVDPLTGQATRGPGLRHDSVAQPSPLRSSRLADGPAGWIESHVAAFTFFKGVPRRIVPDNLKEACCARSLRPPLQPRL